MHACHPAHASPCTTELHMTSIWEQRDSDLITNSLLLIKTCRLHPPPLPFFFACLLPTLACLLVLCSPASPPAPPPPHVHTHPTTSSTPQFQSRTILWFRRCLLPKRAPFWVLQKVISSPLFLLFTFAPLFHCPPFVLHIFKLRWSASVFSSRRSHWSPAHVPNHLFESIHFDTHSHET